MSFIDRFSSYLIPPQLQTEIINSLIFDRKKGYDVLLKMIELESIF